MNNKKRNILLGVLIVGVISMTVAFAALSTTLNISGTANIPTTKWDIHFDNGVDNTPKPTHANGKVNKGTITGLQFAATSITNFTATLYQPNDEVVYNFDIVNAGTIDGQLDNFSKTLTCNSSDCSMITYTIDCEDDSHNDANQSDYILASGDSVSCEMRIKYNDQTNTGNGVYNQGAVNATASATWLYKQVEGSSNSGNQGGNSGGNEQGGNEQQGGGNEQGQGGQDTSSVTGYVIGDDLSDTVSTKGNWPVWIQVKSDNTKEVCGVFSNGTVCIENGKALDAAYVAQKEAELEAAIGAGSCGYTIDDENNPTYAELYCGIDSVEINGDYLGDQNISLKYENGEYSADCTASSNYGYYCGLSTDEGGNNGCTGLE